MAAGGPTLAALTDTQITPITFALAIGGATVAGLLPDIDHPNALLSRGWMPFKKRTGPLGRLLGEFLSLPPRIAGMMSRSVMGHRGGTHSILFCLLWTVAALPVYGLLFAAGAYVLSLITGLVGLPFSPSVAWNWERAHLPTVMPLAMITVFLGYLSHIVADGLNNVPVPYFWPSKRRFFLIPGVLKPLRVTTGSAREGLVRLVVLVVLGIFLLINLLNPILNNISNHQGIFNSLTLPYGQTTKAQRDRESASRVIKAQPQTKVRSGKSTRKLPLASSTEAVLIARRAGCQQKSQLSALYRVYKTKC